MVSGEETEIIRRFVCGQLRDGPDLSTLTLGILKKRYLAHVRCESLSPQAKAFMKQVVEEELMKMQEADENEREETKTIQNKRKREKESDEEIKGGDDEDESKPKKSRHQSGSSSESEDEDDGKTGSDESELDEEMKSGSEDEEQKVGKSRQKGNGKRQISSEDSSEEENKENEETCDGGPKETVKEKGETNSGGEKTPQKDEDSESDSDNKSEKSEKSSSSSDSSDEGDKEKKVLTENKTNNDADSDSSSSEDSGPEDTHDTKKESTKKEKSTKSKTDGAGALVRLKRYIALCGVRRNYMKLLDGCHSVHSQVAVLKKELKDLGVHGNPSIKKCKKVRLQREEAAELAGLDVSNIISAQGRPKRRGASSRQEQQEPPSSTYVRAVDSGSDSDQENKIHRGHRRTTDWSNLQGIISDDADSG